MSKFQTSLWLPEWREGSDYFLVKEVSLGFEGGEKQ